MWFDILISCFCVKFKIILLISTNKPAEILISIILNLYINVEELNFNNTEFSNATTWYIFSLFLDFFNILSVFKVKVLQVFVTFLPECFMYLVFFKWYFLNVMFDWSLRIIHRNTTEWPHWSMCSLYSGCAEHRHLPSCVSYKNYSAYSFLVVAIF